MAAAQQTLLSEYWCRVFSAVPFLDEAAAEAVAAVQAVNGTQSQKEKRKRNPCNPLHQKLGDKFFGFKSDCDEDHRPVAAEIMPLGSMADNILKQLSSISGRFSTAHEVKFLGGRNDGSTTHARYVSRQPIYQNGDRKMYFGFQVRNSETRNSAIYIEFFICDDFCENGCVFGKKELDMEPLYMKHSGREIMGTGLCPARRLSFEDSRKIQNYIFKMFNHNTVDKMHDLLKTSFDREFVSGEDRIIERLGKRHKLSEAEIEIVKEEFIDGERHAYGIQAAFTAAAQKVETFERRADLDRVGGEILEQNDQQWENLVALTA